MERKRRKLWLSTDKGKSWHPVEALEGSIMYNRVFGPGYVYDDGLGHLYRADKPQ